MTEAQDILLWLKSDGIKDGELAEFLNVSREMVYRTRNGNAHYTGETILSELREIAGKLGMPQYSQPVHQRPARTISQPQQKPVPTSPVHHSSPQIQLPKMPSQRLKRYRVSAEFKCPKCGYQQTARVINSYCKSCEHPYECD